MDPALGREISARVLTKPINEAILGGDSPIQQFYRGSTVFVTGSTGFLGKQLVEKLLRSTDVKQLYLLLRPKKGKGVKERFLSLIHDSVFDYVRDKDDVFGKIQPIEGDLSLVKLGIGDQVWSSITGQIDVILHAAASVNFEEPLRVATLTNVRGTREVLTLARDCHKLRSMVHVSTAFSNATRDRFKKDVLEKFYAAPLSPDLMIKMAEEMEENRLNGITTQLLSEWPNTYAFTKCIAEELINNESGNLPLCVVRPSVVISSKAEPTPGWLDPSSAYGPSGILVGVGLGVMHVLLADNDIRIDFMPVDMVNNALLAAGYETAQRWSKGERETKIYTVTSRRQPIYWGEMISCFSNEVRSQYVSPKSVWYPSSVSIKNICLYTILAWHLHFLPAYVVDAVCGILGKPRIFVKICKKVERLTLALSYFSCNYWKFSDENLVKLFENLSPRDKIIYNFDAKSIEWDEELTLWALGVRKYIFKDELRGTMWAIKKQKFFKVLHYLLLAFYIWVYCKIFVFLFGMCFNFE